MSDDQQIRDGTSKSGRMIGRRLLTAAAALLLLLVVGVIGTGIWLDSDGVRGFVVSQVEGLEPENGMRVKIGEIRGSIFGKTEIVDLELHDPKGLFFRAGQVTVDWSPLAWIFNELNINSAQLAEARLERFPELIDTGRDPPILPEFDIYVGSFRAADLVLGQAITGEEQRADLSGAIDITSGRAMVNLDAATTQSGDKLNLVVNAEPDREKLELAADIVAPAGGAIARYLGLSRDMMVQLKGDGNWKKWDGNLQVTSANRRQVGIWLAARDGVFGFDGGIAADLLPEGLSQRIASPRLALTGSATYQDGLADVDLVVRSAALPLTANGGIDLGRNCLDSLRIGSQVRNPSALIANMNALDLELKAMLYGNFSALRYQYLLTAPQLAFGKSLFMGVRAEGEGQRDAGGWDIPVELTANDLIGNGDLPRRLVAGFSGKVFLRFEQGAALRGQCRVRIPQPDRQGDY